MKKSEFFAVLLLFACLQGTKMLGIPNPLIEFKNIDELSANLGFAPIMISQNSEFKPNLFIGIDGKIADIGFVNKNMKLRLRTAENLSEFNDDISGIYGVLWEKIDIGDCEIFIAEIDKEKFGAKWQNEKYLFSLFGENVDKNTFLAIFRQDLTLQCKKTGL